MCQISGNVKNGFSSSWASHGSSKNMFDILYEASWCKLYAEDKKKFKKSKNWILPIIHVQTDPKTTILKVG